MSNMHLQIWGFLQSVLGWIFVACTMAMEGWKISAIGGMGGSSIIKVAWYWSNLWRSCFTDSTAVFNCRDFGVLWSVELHIQIVRGLLMGALSLGMLGFVLSLLGMECTYIGGKELSKHRKIYAGGCCHIISGKYLTSFLTDPFSHQAWSGVFPRQKYDFFSNSIFSVCS
uniref:Claudin n=1 Tax=Oryzias melastigma TaxID=30732 RepID=A0A3B3D0V2_ORYME